MHVYLEEPPRDQPDRWAGRPFRALSALALSPPSHTGHADPFAKPHLETTPELAKARFLENLWAVQARLRTRLGRSIVLYGGEREVGPATLARTWWNLYSRTAFLSETKKVCSTQFGILPIGAEPLSSSQKWLFTLMQKAQQTLSPLGWVVQAQVERPM